MQLARLRLAGTITRHKFSSPPPLVPIFGNLSKHMGSRRARVISLQAAQDVHPDAKQVLQFWLGDDFLEAKPNSFPLEKKKIWFSGGPDLDKEMVEKFGDLLEQVAKTGLPDWSRHYNGLAAVLLLDQYSRNIYRGNALMYAMDAVANEKAQALVDSGDAAEFPLMHRLWLIYPFMHSENLDQLEIGLGLVQQMVDASEKLTDATELQHFLRSALNYFKAHHQVIKQWGRYPHRNQVLSRDTTPEEEQGMANGTIPKFG